MLLNSYCQIFLQTSFHVCSTSLVWKVLVNISTVCSSEVFKLYVQCTGIYILYFFQFVPRCTEELCVHVHVLGNPGDSVHCGYNTYQPVQHGLCDSCVLFHVVWTGVPDQATQAACPSVSIHWHSGVINHFLWVVPTVISVL